MGIRVAVPVFVLALAGDLISKAWVVGHDPHVYFNEVAAELPRRGAMCLLAIAVVAGLTKLAAHRKLGRPWAAWVGGALLVAGVLGNGVAALVWKQGVPDFIVTGDWDGNVADFEIWFGLVGGIFATALGFMLLYAREKLRGLAEPQERQELG
jgi:hypothetical protein